MIQFLFLRLKQCYRFLLDLGWLRLLLVLPIIAVLMVGFLQTWVQNNFQESIPIIALLLFGLFNIQIARKDFYFIEKLGIPPYQVYFIEYSFFSMILWLPLIIAGHLYAPLLLFAGIILISLVKFRFTFQFQLNKNPFLPLISPILFEWKSAIRINFVGLLLLWLIGLIFCKYVIAIPLCIILLGISAAAFYLEAEPFTMIEALELSASDFIRSKIRLHLQHFYVCIFPHLLTFLFFHLEYWYLIIYVLVAISILQVFSIVYKYALYQPNISLRSNMILIGFMAGGILNPMLLFLLPVLIIMTGRYYRKAVESLEIGGRS